MVFDRESKQTKTKNQGRQAALLETVGEEKVKSLGPQAREPGRLIDGRLLSSWIAVFRESKNTRSASQAD